MLALLLFVLIYYYLYSLKYILLWTASMTISVAPLYHVLRYITIITNTFIAVFVHLIIETFEMLPFD